MNGKRIECGVCYVFRCSRAATGSADFEAKIWCALSGDELVSFQHNHIVRSVDFSLDGSRLMTGGQEKKIRIFDLENSNSDPQIFEGHGGTVKRVIFIDQDTFISIADDKTFRKWDLRYFGLLFEKKPLLMLVCVKILDYFFFYLAQFPTKERNICLFFFVLSKFQCF